MSKSSAPVIEDGKVVSLHYTLKNADGELLDSSEGREALDYLHGAENIVPGLEEALTGRKLGEKLHVSVPPEMGYGEKTENSVQPVPRNLFPPDEPLEPGMDFGTTDDEGNDIQVWVVGIEGDTVLIDLDHPLAGETLEFDVEIVGIRDAAADELEHGHPHGLDGPDHD